MLVLFIALLTGCGTDKEGDGTTKITIPDNYNATKDECFEFIPEQDGSISDYYCYEGNPYGYDEISDVVIPYMIDGEYVKTIFGFDEKNIASVVIPDSVNYIKDGSFENNKITQVVLSKNLIKVGSFAFYGNDGLEFDELVLPDTLTEIGESAFRGIKINKLVMGSELWNIGASAFENCGIESIKFNDKIDSFQERVFSGNKLKKLKVPDSVFDIKECAFCNNELKELELGKSVVEIEFDAFSNEDDYEGTNKITKIITKTKDQTNFDWNFIVDNEYDNITIDFQEVKE